MIVMTSPRHALAALAFFSLASMSIAAQQAPGHAKAYKAVDVARQFEDMNGHFEQPHGRFDSKSRPVQKTYGSHGQGGAMADANLTWTIGPASASCHHVGWSEHSGGAIEEETDEFRYAVYQWVAASPQPVAWFGYAVNGAPEGFVQSSDATVMSAVEIKIKIKGDEAEAKSRVELSHESSDLVIAKWEQGLSVPAALQGWTAGSISLPWTEFELDLVTIPIDGPNDREEIKGPGEDVDGNSAPAPIALLIGESGPVYRLTVRQSARQETSFRVQDTIPGGIRAEARIMHGGHSKYVLVLPKQNPGAVVLDTPLGPMGAPYGGPGLKVAPKSGGTGVVVTPISPLGPPPLVISPGPGGPLAPVPGWGPYWVPTQVPRAPGCGPSGIWDIDYDDDPLPEEEGSSEPVVDTED
jgi:hypothetical protein